MEFGDGARKGRHGRLERRRLGACRLALILERRNGRRERRYVAIQQDIVCFQTGDRGLVARDRPFLNVVETFPSPVTSPCS